MAAISEARQVDAAGIAAVGRRNDRIVAVWLLLCCALVFAMVVVGGVTRLTGSGLSMVDWRPITGVLPPLTDAQWQETFALYQQSPEFRHVNSHMDVEDFKGIFWLEYIHRLLGRAIGLVFLVPLLFFLWSGHIRRNETPRYLLMFLLGGLQGLLGWYMVKSGLSDDPRVSQYRLTAHLVAAFLIFAYMFWVALSLLFRRQDGPRHKLYRRTLALTALVMITVVSGGFVAGLKAGHLYNTFPMMGDRWIPEGLMALTPVWRNFFDNAVTAQFDHRLLAVTTLVVVVVYWLAARGVQLPARARPALHGLLLVAFIQVVLGVSTLLLAVPTLLAAAHQATALLLFGIALYLCHALRGSGH
jgi:cytochrome c oxidase assembly protein subunit 15